MNIEELIERYEGFKQSQIKLKEDTPSECTAQHILLDHYVKTFEAVIKDLKELTAGRCTALDMRPDGEFIPLKNISRTETIDSDLIRDQNGRRKKPLY